MRNRVRWRGQVRNEKLLNWEEDEAEAQDGEEEEKNVKNRITFLRLSFTSDDDANVVLVVIQVLCVCLRV